ncbi:hypothetical protein Mlute_02889 [Meiothermus luteus]|uniref:Uncharacterized protein n=1 Tax=Meiothermus luteus TaxID=2026184 RepID=A0A399ED90_9DEIN|nr:hypothetical protein Mlute_02889 [Meiothermus luteus]
MGPPPRLHRKPEGLGHGHGVLRLGDGGVDQDGIQPELHHLRGMGGKAKPGVHHHRGEAWALPGEELQKGPGPHPPARADGGGQGHHRGGAEGGKPLGQDQVGPHVGQDHEALLQKPLRGLERLQGVREKVGGIGDDLQLHPVLPGEEAAQPGEAHRLLRRLGPGGVGEKPHPLQGLQKPHVPRGPHLHPPHGNRHHLCPRRPYGLPHHPEVLELAGPQDEAAF